MSRSGLAGRRSRVRCVASIIFAFAFLFVGIAHAASHFDALSSSGPQISTNIYAPDDGPKIDVTEICHCAFCAGVVLPATCGSVVAETIEGTFEPAPFARLLPHNPTFQTPPPKQLI